MVPAFIGLWEMWFGALEKTSCRPETDIPSPRRSEKADHRCRLIARIPDGSIHAVIGAVTACVLYR